MRRQGFMEENLTDGGELHGMFRIFSIRRYSVHVVKYIYIYICILKTITWM